MIKGLAVLVSICVVAVIMCSCGGSGVVPPASAQSSGSNVLVVNSATQAVPISAQGTTAVSGAVTVSNSPTVNAQQAGAWNVAVTNASLPVTGAVGVNNLPVDNAGNLRVSMVSTPQPQDTPHYEFKHVFVMICDLRMCTDVDGTLTTLSSDGWELVHVGTPIYDSGKGGYFIFYTLRRAVQQQVAVSSSGTPRQRPLALRAAR